MINTDNFAGIIESFYEKIRAVGADKANIKLSADKWSLKEMIGHLIDSASNNHQRFVRLQSGDLLNFPAYEGEKWVKAERYDSLDWAVVTLLWHNYNRLLLHIVRNTGDEHLKNVWVKDEDTAITLEELITNYYEHIKVHVKLFSDREQEINGRA